MELAPLESVTLSSTRTGVDTKNYNNVLLSLLAEDWKTSYFIVDMAQEEN